MAHQLQFDIGIITETHIPEEEMGAFQLPGYELIHKVGSNKQLGEVMIIATPHVSCKKLENVPPPKSPVDACSCLLYPAKTEEYSIRLTGLYVPPSAEATPDMLRALTDPADLTSEGGRRNVTHLIVWDLNPNTWSRRDKTLYHEWIHENGMWELSHPEQPTFKTGAVLDKFFLVPGDFVPDEWLSPPCKEDGLKGRHIIDLDIEHYPAPGGRSV